MATPWETIISGKGVTKKLVWIALVVPTTMALSLHFTMWLFMLGIHLVVVCTFLASVILVGELLWRILTKREWKSMLIPVALLICASVIYEFRYYGDRQNYQISAWRDIVHPDTAHSLPPDDLPDNPFSGRRY